MTDKPPLRMYYSEVAALAKLSKGTLRERIKAGLFPSPIDRGKEKIFSGEAVYTALGLESGKEETGEDRWVNAI